MSVRTTSAAVFVALVVTLLGLAIPGSAGPDKIAFPANFKNGVLYTIADRYDVKQYRELYATPEAIEAAKAGKPLPSGTILTLIQYKAQVDAQGNLLKDANGRFLGPDVPRGRDVRIHLRAAPEHEGGRRSHEVIIGGGLLAYSRKPAGNGSSGERTSWLKPVR
jgi:hypothetical protein